MQTPPADCSASDWEIAQLGGPSVKQSQASRQTKAFKLLHVTPGQIDLKNLKFPSLDTAIFLCIGGHGFRVLADCMPRQAQFVYVRVGEKESNKVSLGASSKVSISCCLYYYPTQRNTAYHSLLKPASEVTLFNKPCTLLCELFVALQDPFILNSKPKTFKGRPDITD